MVLGLDQHVADHFAAPVDAGEQPSRAGARGEVANQLPAVQGHANDRASGPLPQRVGAVDPGEEAVAVGGPQRAQCQLAGSGQVGHCDHDASSVMSAGAHVRGRGSPHQRLGGARRRIRLRPPATADRPAAGWRA